MTLPTHVELVEVGPRDGLQNESSTITTETKLELIQRLANSGLERIEMTSVVSPRWVPQMADHEAVMSSFAGKTSARRYSVLVPNRQGLESAMAQGVREVAVFTAASESFTQRNINASIEQSLRRFEPVMRMADEHGINVRGYVSCALGCPYEGQMDATRVADVSRALWQMGCREISLGDTIGIGTPLAVKRMLEAVLRDVPLEATAVHFHDTYGQALANIYASLQEGVTVIDSAVAGLGGCPYATGASGNVATEDVVYLLNGLGIECGVDLANLVETGNWIAHHLGRDNSAKAARALTSAA
ncbi:hydroxymethylglutaryl-CoA lyase [Halomonas cupida]|uniref:hydroxymethylglutaryl-CoA lyase n=1 Tax=Halomonas cupida TaxID=44933 RepID=A0A1M7IWS1_9GAMM|nr:hydroxymethylglutaryl-CoA lyase [Halomonas cupida]GEN24222.1 hydroxymethylglutaryl-CoA lyase [Halomonas cupida]SHM45254.1 hydroxymethylglutaryl-CoA lyase [Halomonas cupida]